ncbi:hypothetical protein BGX38DRAFT_1165039 [Terfezia claveryi]|nr:hypothetical protein BGX38DRAFT_1165039 [Terfezia claveryi]
MVAVVSTRGSSEGFFGGMVVGLMWPVLERGRCWASLSIGRFIRSCMPWRVVWWVGGRRRSAFFARMVARLRGRRPTEGEIRDGVNLGV